VKMLLAAAEHSCVVLQTLRNAVRVQTHFNQGEPVAAPAQ